MLNKVDTELQLALDVSEIERDDSLDLGTGYSEDGKRWRLVVKYAGDDAELRESIPEVVVTELLNGYLIVEIAESDVSKLVAMDRVEYVEKPKNLSLSEMEGMRVSCVSGLYRQYGTSLQGQGTIVGIVDSGIDYSHPDFRKADGTTRILALWDQSVSEIYGEDTLNVALQQGRRENQLRIVPEVDVSGHGTHVASIAVGNGRASDGMYVGVAPQASLLVVKLATNRDGYSNTVDLMLAVDWIIRYSLKVNMPLALNLSYGNNYGDHNGGNLFERYLDDVSTIGHQVMVVGMGNEGSAGRHVALQLNSTDGIGLGREVEFYVSRYERALDLQIWSSFVDDIEVCLEGPNGERTGYLYKRDFIYHLVVGNTRLAILLGSPTPYVSNQEFYIAMVPVDDYIASGIWRIFIRPRYLREGMINLWLPVTGETNLQTQFLNPTVEGSLTIPATATSVIAVGAYDAITNRYAPFSGRGGVTGSQKPDLVAPGVGITAASPEGGYDTRSGTSMATPFVTGASALLMQWGIVLGNDPYLYGEKVRAYLQRGTKQIPGFYRYPNDIVGWGSLCVERSIL